MTPSSIYHDLVEQGRLLDDPAQREVAKTMTELAEALPKHEEAMALYWEDLDEWRALRTIKVEEEKERRARAKEEAAQSWSQRVKTFLGQEVEEPTGPRPEYLPDEYYAPYGLPARPQPSAAPLGLYIHGGVGSGKSMMMDILFEATSVDVSHRRRVHMHSFMLELYDRFHQFNLTESELDKAWLLDVLEQERLEGDDELPLNPLKIRRKGVAPPEGKATNPYYPPEMQRRPRRKLPRASRQRKSGVVESVSKDIVGRRRLLFLCFDEFTLNDIGDAVILKGLFTQLFAAGVVVVATGNRAPTELNRTLAAKGDFHEFLELFKEKLQMMELHSADDYRERLAGPDAPVLRSIATDRATSPAPFFATTSNYPFSLSAPADAATGVLSSPFFQRLFDSPALPPGFPYLNEDRNKEKEEGEKTTQKELDSVYSLLSSRALEEKCPMEDSAGLELTDGCVVPVMMGRELTVPRCRGGVAFFSFEELCARPLGAADYISICHHFHTLVLSGIPQMKLDTRDQARRFITLVDELYNRKVKLVCSAAVQPRFLFSGSDSWNSWQETAENLEFEYEGPRDMAIDVTQVNPGTRSKDVLKANERSDHLEGQPSSGNNTLVSGEEERFAFDRAVSRLLEMTSPRYLHQTRL